MASKYAYAIVVVLLSVHATLLAWGAFRHSPVIDEVGHLPAGLSHWKLGRFGLYRVNPPLPRMVAACPILAYGANTDWTRYSDAPSARSEFEVARDFIAANGDRSFRLYTIARLACIPFSLLGAYFCFRWASELYGHVSGLLALIFWCFCPNILAHGQLNTPDIPATSLGLAANYCFWKWLLRPSGARTLFTGVVLGLAELTKTTWLILFPLWTVTWFFWRLSCPSRMCWRNWLEESAKGTVIGLVAIVVINLGYGFAGSGTRLTDYVFLSRMFTGQDSQNFTVPGARARFSDTWIGRLPIPLPKDYVLGVDRQKLDFEVGLRSYLRGNWRERGGWWYYYVYALVVKVPIGTQLLIVLAAFCCLAKQAGPRRDHAVLLLPAFAVLALVSSQTGFSHHLRYVLPSLPFVFVWASSVGKLLARSWLSGSLVVASLSWSVASSLSIYPHSLSYFNEWAGGPTRGHAHLIDSNIDWGQDRNRSAI